MWGVRWRRVVLGCCLEAKFCALGKLRECEGKGRKRSRESLFAGIDSMRLRDYDQHDDAIRMRRARDQVIAGSLGGGV
jgi:hypothetical protein